MQKALNTYSAEVREGIFPDKEHSFTMPQDLLQQLTAELQEEGIL